MTITDTIRTSVATDANDLDETDEHPGCFGTVGEDGSLDIIDMASSDIEATYAPGEWVAYEVTA
jgi:hypothetical protein